MADALCGPSNPLQNLQKHSQADRTLQQDRIVGLRHSPAQGFRSADPRAGSLDADFHAFENAQPNPFHFEQPFLDHAIPHFQPQVAPNWAADFQKLHVSQPLPSHQFRTDAPLIRSAAGGWHNEFMRQRENITPIAQGKQAVRDTRISNVPQYWPGQNGIQSFDQYVSNGFHQNYQPQSSAQNLESVHPEMEAQFEQAFSDAFANLEQVDHEQRSADILHEDGTYTNDHSQILDMPPEQIPIGSDAIPYTEAKDRTAAQDTRDADELARTAGELLNSVHHDTSTKFQNSQFLSFMRQIRDREIEVQNNDFQSTEKGMLQHFNAGNTALETPLHDLTPQQLSETPMHDAMPEQLHPHDPNTFQFPDMNEVYHHTLNENGLETEEQVPRTRYAGSWDYPLTSDVRHFDTTQVTTQPGPEQLTLGQAGEMSFDHQALHPGGRMYPSEASPRISRAEMSGGIMGENGDSRDEENGMLSRRRTWQQMPNV